MKYIARERNICEASRQKTLKTLFQGSPNAEIPFVFLERTFIIAFFEKRQ